MVFFYCLLLLSSFTVSVCLSPFGGFILALVSLKKRPPHPYPKHTKQKTVKIFVHMSQLRVYNKSKVPWNHNFLFSSNPHISTSIPHTNSSKPHFQHTRTKNCSKSQFSNSSKPHLQHTQRTVRNLNSQQRRNPFKVRHGSSARKRVRNMLPSRKVDNRAFGSLGFFEPTSGRSPGFDECCASQKASDPSPMRCIPQGRRQYQQYVPEQLARYGYKDETL